MVMIAANSAPLTAAIAKSEAEIKGFASSTTGHFKALRAVAARFACDQSATAAEAYELLDDILKFAAHRAKRRRARTIEEEPEQVLLPAV